VYRGSTEPEANIYREISRIQIPVRVVRAGRFSDAVQDFSTSATVPDLATRFPNARDFHFPDHSHFLPMEAPDLAADLILGRQ
jgi:pimeloyl-ACP methyl ester carboxylesterase